MVENDFKYFKMCYEAKLIRGPFLEVGSSIVQEETRTNLCGIAQELGLNPAQGTDLYPGKGVDFVTDFSLPTDEFKRSWRHGLFETVAIFNTLEHTFDPVTVLANVVLCVKPNGTIIVIAPCVWGLHDHPKDYVRLLPHWYEKSAELFNLHIVRDKFCFISEFGIVAIDSLKRDMQFNLPSYLNLASTTSLRYWVSRIAHRLFNTYGRSHRFTHSSIGCVYIAPGTNRQRSP